MKERLCEECNTPLTVHFYCTDCGHTAPPPDVIADYTMKFKELQLFRKKNDIRSEESLE